jgi:hypothetical protein
MGWITNEDNTRVFRINFRENRKLHKLDLLAKEEERTPLEFNKHQIQPEISLLAAEAKLDQDLDRLSRLVDQIVEESFICQGMVRRKGVFQSVSRLNNPLTDVEKAHIRRVKFNAKPRSFDELKSCLAEISTVNVVTRCLNCDEGVINLESPERSF